MILALWLRGSQLPVEIGFAALRCGKRAISVIAAQMPNRVAAVLPNTHSFCASVMPESSTMASDRV